MRSVQRFLQKWRVKLWLVVKKAVQTLPPTPRLADVIAKAKAANVPNDNIERAIKKADGSGDGKNYEHNIYEGYGPGGVAVVVECLTDNKTAPPEICVIILINSAAIWARRASVFVAVQAVRRYRYC